MTEDQRQQEQEDAARQPTKLSTEIEALKEKFRREADQEAKRELDKKTWWTDEDTREVEREIVNGLADHAAKVQLGSFIRESFGNGAQEAANLSDTAAEVLLNLKTVVSGASRNIAHASPLLPKVPANPRRIINRSFSGISINFLPTSMT
ncbi:hypothetical protein HFN89_06045 [Rhizobium laguerreae]|nr:hypothetical protein [Rhizobium laguerreae]